MRLQRELLRRLMQTPGFTATAAIPLGNLGTLDAELFSAASAFQFWPRYRAGLRSG